MKQTIKRSVSFLLAFVMVVAVFATIPFTTFAANDYTAHDDYYKVISKNDYDLAPGIVESEIVLNNAAGTHRQVAHVVEVDLSNPYTKVIPSYKGMVPTPGKYGVQIMSEQAKWAEANGYGNVVAAMNLSLSWYNSQYYVDNPHLVGEPLGYMVLDGEVYINSQGQTNGAQTCVVINFDEKDGEKRPADMPKVEIRATSSAITGWEEQVIPANFGFLVKDGKNQYSKDNNAANGASRSFVGIKEDGTFVMVMNDGRQSPYSAGFTNYEMAEFMLSLGCVVAVNGDGGGSSAFLSQRPGEELKINCSPSDGAERPTTHGILVISTAPATGEFVRANITSENKYYTPGSTVKFSALGTDLVGTAADIPADVTWQLADSSMGTVENGVFVSNGKVGTATVQMVWKGEVVGSASVEIVIPTEFSFSQAVMTVPFDKEVTIGINATINGGLNSVVIKPEDVKFTTTNSALGTFDGLKFTSVSEANAPADLKSTLTATFVHNTALVATAALNLGKGSEVLFDFEKESDIDEWNIADVNGNDQGFYQKLTFATGANGKVHDGIGSMRVEMNPISANGISNGGYGQSDLFLDQGVVVENAKSIGFWAYIPDEYEHCWIRVLYWYDPDGDGKFDKKNTITVMNQPEVYNNWDESGWKYFSIDVSAYSKILIPGLDCKDIIAYNASKNDANNFRFIEFMFPHTNTNDLWKEYGTINGLQTVYIDNITADFSDAVDDREAPVFSKVELAGNDNSTELKKYATVTTKNNLLTMTATVSENTAKTNATGLNPATAKAYIDGVGVPVTFANGRMTISDVAVANGTHRVKFEICDNMGNKSVVIRLVKVDSDVDASTIQVVPADPTLNNLYGGSIYWMNVNANKIETIQSVKTVIDLNYGNHFELDHMVLADGFTATYTIDEENNTATIVITRTGDNAQSGAATLAALPIRVIYYDTDIKIDGYTAETYWNTYGFWPYDLKVDVDMGEITYVDGYTSDVLGAFSNEEFSVDTELQAAFSDPAFKADRGTAHVHAPVAVDDLAATCTKPGYTGRTYCEVCDSVVDWGTAVEATGHDYEVTEDGIYTCGVCSKAFVYVNGELQSGWVNINGKDYYCGANGEAVNGVVAVDGHTYTFVNHVLTDAAWEHDGAGLTAWWAGGQIKGGATYESKWKTINGKKYYFTDIYAVTGLIQVKISTDLGYKYHIFGDDGVWLENYTGLYEGTYGGKTGTYYVENGICVYKGLVEVDGYYYYINSSFKAVKNCKYVISAAKANGLVEPGEYTFGADGKMIVVENEPEVVKNGLYVDEDGEIRYYVNNVATYAGVVKDAEGNLYYINSSKKAVKNCKYAISAAKANGLVEPGEYTFGADGKMIAK
ncbi:MAG: phosphodiester glycosidase family protein [Clostridia bacterium]|nr:phosphodiester glycosidase family protein [Clostridia bacterium]